MRDRSGCIRLRFDPADDELVRSLRKGGYSIYFRHSQTDWTQHDQIYQAGDWTSCGQTGISNPTLLVASHIKPWRDCAVGEHLYLFNGLLFAAPLDALFDRALISFDVNCSMMICETLAEHERQWVLT